MGVIKQMMNIYLPTYNAVQSSSIVMSPHWQKIVPARPSSGGLHRHRPAADSRGVRLTPTMYFTHTSTRKGYAQNRKLNAQSQYCTMQHSRNAHYTSGQPD